jgi:hypothetical protein
VHEPPGTWYDKLAWWWLIVGERPLGLLPLDVLPLGVPFSGRAACDVPGLR